MPPVPQPLPHVVLHQSHLAVLSNPQEKHGGIEAGDGGGRDHGLPESRALRNGVCKFFFACTER